MGKPTTAEISNAAAKAGLNFSVSDVARLEKGELIPLNGSNVAPATGTNCSGIKLIDLGGGCGLYLNLFPPGVSVCCQTA